MNKTLITITAVLLATGSYAQSDQEDKKPQVKITTTTEKEESTDWGYDRNPSRSKIGISDQKIPGKTKLLKTTTEITQSIDIKTTYKKLLCESDIDLEYYQRDTSTEVRTLFTSSNCPEFNAKYQLRIMYFDANGKIQRIVADEEWPVGKTDQVRKTYPIEPDSKLQRVSSRILSCTCRQSQ